MLDMATFPGTQSKDFLSILDLDQDELLRLLDVAVELKARRAMRRRTLRSEAPLAGVCVALLFEKPSLRTRTTFEIAVRELGAEPVAIPAEMALGTREPICDVARNLDRWVDALVIRTFAQDTAAAFAAAAPRMHVVNALTDQEHPCQALADFMTLRERWGTLRGRRIAYVGDGNNVAASLVHAAAMLGVSVHLASPRGYELPDRVMADAARVAREGAEIRLFSDPARAVAGAEAVYTDVWASMGQEAESAARRQAFAGFQVNERLMAAAAPGALFMHCLPAHRGEEVSAGVLESPSAVVFDQAENRLHAQKALLTMLLA